MSIFNVNLETFDIAVAIAVLLFVVAGILFRPDSDPRPPASAYAHTVLCLGLAVFSFAFLFMTP